MEHEPQRAAVVTDDSFATLIRLFMSPANAKWREPPERGGYSKSTKDVWGRELRFISRPDTLGAISRHEIRPALVQAFFDGIADRPGKCSAAWSAIKQLEKWCIVRDLLPRQITLGVEIAERDDTGHIPWTDEQVALGEAKARPDLAKAITLISNTGQRGSDAVRMGPTDIESFQGIDGINVIQQKTGRVQWVPITPELARAMESWPRVPGPFLRMPDGRPWKRADLAAHWNRHRDSNDDLRPLGKAAVVGKPTIDTGLVMHGLRGTACVRLRRAGATIPQIADMVGMSEAMVARYCRFSIQRENAVAAVIHLERTISERTRDMLQKGRR
jgi:integrase